MNLKCALIKTLSAVAWSLNKNHSNSSKTGKNYSYDDVCGNLFWFRWYIDRPDLLCFFHPLAYFQWLDYKYNYDLKHPNYNYWLVCYAFGI